MEQHVLGRFAEIYSMCIEAEHFSNGRWRGKNRQTDTLKYLLFGFSSSSCWLQTRIVVTHFINLKRFILECGCRCFVVLVVDAKYIPLSLPLSQQEWEESKEKRKSEHNAECDCISLRKIEIIENIIFFLCWWFGVQCSVFYVFDYLFVQISLCYLVIYLAEQLLALCCRLASKLTCFLCRFYLLLVVLRKRNVYIGSAWPIFSAIWWKVLLLNVQCSMPSASFHRLYRQHNIPIFSPHI